MVCCLVVGMFVGVDVKWGVVLCGDVGWGVVSYEEDVICGSVC